jgi:MSHA biogenesis protein MshK
MNAAALRNVLLAAACLAAPAALAQGLADPTRPPSAAAAQGGPDDAIPGGRQLQSVLLSGGRKIAVIDGNMVALGGMLGEARVVKITETEVVLKTGEETETLKLFPGVNKQAVKRGARRARTDAPAEGSNVRGGSK